MLCHYVGHRQQKCQGCGRVPHGRKGRRGWRHFLTQTSSREWKRCPSSRASVPQLLCLPQLSIYPPHLYAVSPSCVGEQMWELHSPRCTPRSEVFHTCHSPPVTSWEAPPPSWIILHLHAVSLLTSARALAGACPLQRDTGCAIFTHSRLSTPTDNHVASHSLGGRLTGQASHGHINAIFSQKSRLCCPWPGTGRNPFLNCPTSLLFLASGRLGGSHSKLLRITRCLLTYPHILLRIGKTQLNKQEPAKETLVYVTVKCRPPWDLQVKASRVSAATTQALSHVKTLLAGEKRLNCHGKTRSKATPLFKKRH